MIPCNPVWCGWKSSQVLIIIKGSELCFSREDEKLPATAQLVSAEPDVSIVERDQATDQFICLACDGIYDVFSNDDLANYINSQMSIREELEQIATEVIDTSLHKVRLTFCPYSKVTFYTVILWIFFSRTVKDSQNLVFAT